MQIILEQKNGVRVPFPLGNFGIDKIRFEELVKCGKIYHVIKTDKVEIIRVS
jgi:hypothetical protein